MAVIVQAVALSGQIVEGARWTIGPSLVAESHTMQVNIRTKNAEILKYVAHHGTPECSTEREDKGSVNLSFVVKQVRHMLETGDGTLDTMIVIMPTNRTVEQVLLYLFEKGKVDDRFAKAVAG